MVLDSHRKICYRKKGQPPKNKPRPKHPVKIHVWGGISKRGATKRVYETCVNEVRVYTRVNRGSHASEVPSLTCRSRVARVSLACRTRVTRVSHACHSRVARE